MHHKICPILAPLRTAPPLIGSDEDRVRRARTVQMSKRALIEITSTEAAKFLVEGQYELAARAAQG